MSDNEFKLIGVYKIDHALKKWVVGEEDMIVQNVFHGHSH
jgi:archaellum component FlaF (FlaF/FlaG flagellin family)